MVHAVFGVDKWNLLPLDSCLIGGSHPDDVCSISSHQDYLIVRALESAGPSGLQDDGVLCFRKQFDGSVSNGDIVVPSWAVDRLGVMNGHDVLLSHACLKNLEPSEVSRVIFIFEGRKSYRHWDEVATSSTITTPGAWSSDWPTGISQKALTKFLPVLINSRILVDNSLIVLDVLDVTMMFRVKLKRARTSNRITSPEPQCSKKSPSIRAVCFSSLLHSRLRIITQIAPHSRTNNKSKHSGNNGYKTAENCLNKNIPNSASVVAEHSESLFCDIAYRRIMTICAACYDPSPRSDSIINNALTNEQNSAPQPHTEKGIGSKVWNGSRVWNGIRSLLISAPEGAGKSYLLSEVEHSLGIMRENILRNDERTFQIITLSAKNCRHHASPSSPIESLVSGVNGFLLTFRHHLLKSLQHLDNRNSHYTEENILNVLIPLRIILILDDVEHLLIPFLSDSDENEGNNSAEDSGINGSGSPTALAAFHMRQVLHFISIPNNGFDQIIVIGATRISASMLPRGHLGAPEFESVMSLPRPSLIDRQNILHSMITNSNIVLEGLKTESDPRSHTPGDDNNSKTINANNGNDGFAAIFLVNNSDDSVIQNQNQHQNVDSNDSIAIERNNTDMNTNTPADGVYVCDSTDSTNTSLWVVRLSDLTAGYLPGDLSSVVRRAVGTFLGHESSSKTEQSAMRNNADISSSTADGGKTKHGKRVNFLSWKSILLVLASLPPKQLKKLDFLSSGGTSDFGSVSWDDFYGYGEVKKKLQRLLKMAKKDSNLNEDSDSNGRKDILTIDERNKITSNSTVFGGNSDNILPPRPSLSQSMKINSAKITGIVLHGPSGCGKSYLAGIIATEAKMNFVSVRSSDLLSKYFGQTEASIRMLFTQVRAAAPCVLFFDEFDVLAYKRGTNDSTGNSGGGLQTRVLSTFLNELDGVVSHDYGEEGGVLVLAACTDITVLDDALLRPGRLQHHIELSLPSRSDIVDILSGRIRKLKCGDDVCAEHLADVMWTLDRPVSSADVDDVCSRALMARVREEVTCNMTQHTHSHALTDNSSRVMNDVEASPASAEVPRISSSSAIVHSYISSSNTHASTDYSRISYSNNVKENKNDDQNSEKEISIGVRNFLEALNECFPSLAKTSEEEHITADSGSLLATSPPFVWNGSFNEGEILNPR